MYTGITSQLIQHNPILSRRPIRRNINIDITRLTYVFRSMRPTAIRLTAHNTTIILRRLTRHLPRRIRVVIIRANLTHRRHQSRTINTMRTMESNILTTRHAIITLLLLNLNLHHSHSTHSQVLRHRSQIRKTNRHRLSKTTSLTNVNPDQRRDARNTRIRRILTRPNPYTLSIINTTLTLLLNTLLLQHNLNQHNHIFKLYTNHVRTRHQMNTLVLIIRSQLLPGMSLRTLLTISQHTLVLLLHRHRRIPSLTLRDRIHSRAIPNLYIRTKRITNIKVTIQITVPSIRRMSRIMTLNSNRNRYSSITITTSIKVTSFTSRHTGGL